MKHLRQYIRTILEANSAEEPERSDTHKVIHLFLSEGGSAQAIELAEVLPDIDPRVVELFSKIKSQVEEIIELGRGNFPEEWAKDPEIQRYGISDGPYLGPFMKAVRELRHIAESEASGDDEAWRESGKGSMQLGKEFQGALRAVSVVVKGKQTPEQMMATTMGMGTHFAALAERFGIWL